MNEKKYTHLVYQIESINDVVHHFSPKNYELLSEGFVACPETVRAQLTPEDDIFMEITGKMLSEEEEETIDRAIQLHYGLALSEICEDMRNARIRIVWFLISLIFSAVFLFMVNDDTQDLFMQFAYFPFWFFGYRFLTYTLMDYKPMMTKKKWTEKLLSMKLAFTKEPLGDISQGEMETIISKREKNRADRSSTVKSGTLVQSYFMDGDELCLECNIVNEIDLVCYSGIQGHIRISNELSGYLEKALPFIRKGQRIRLDINGLDYFDDEDKDNVRTGLKEYYELRLKEIKGAIWKNIRNICFMSGGFLLACIMILVLGPMMNIAYHEFLIMLVWFFGDYLVEFALLSQVDLWREKKRWEIIGQINIVFN